MSDDNYNPIPSDPLNDIPTNEEVIRSIYNNNIFKKNINIFIQFKCLKKLD